MAEFSSGSLSAIMAQIQKSVDDALAKEVAKKVKQHVSDAVRDVVYKEGVPEIYDRRGKQGYIGTGSLRDPEEMISVVSNGTLEVSDAALPSVDWDMDLSESIQNGYGNREEWYDQPRPFMMGGDKSAEETLIETGDHVEAMKKGLQRIYGKNNVI